MSEKEVRNLSEKQILIYKAIVDLINEGADVSDMKVGEITARAGIGKGTAYEYFSSKEEMVIEALEYNTMMQVMTVKAMVEKKDAFRDKFMCILNYMDENKDQIRTFLWMVRLQGKEWDISSYTSDGPACREAMDKIGQLVELAVWFLAFAEAEGVITEKNKDYQISALLSQIVQFAFYLHFGGERDLESVKNFIYEGFIKQLT